MLTTKLRCLHFDSGDCPPCFWKYMCIPVHQNLPEAELPHFKWFYNPDFDNYMVKLRVANKWPQSCCRSIKIVVTCHHKRFSLNTWLHPIPPPLKIEWWIVIGYSVTEHEVNNVTRRRIWLIRWIQNFPGICATGVSSIRIGRIHTRQLTSPYQQDLQGDRLVIAVPYSDIHNVLHNVPCGWQCMYFILSGPLIPTDH